MTSRRCSGWRERAVKSAAYKRLQAFKAGSAPYRSVAAFELAEQEAEHKRAERAAMRAKVDNQMRRVTTAGRDPGLAECLAKCDRARLAQAVLCFDNVYGGPPGDEVARRAVRTAKFVKRQISSSPLRAILFAAWWDDCPVDDITAAILAMRGAQRAGGRG